MVTVASPYIPACGPRSAPIDRHSGDNASPVSMGMSGASSGP